MSAYDMDAILGEILTMIKPLRNDWIVRAQIISELRGVVESVESLKGATVEPFGSFVSNLFTRWADLDISIELPNGSHISSLGKKRKQALLGDVLKALTRQGGCHKLRFIPNARVPVLKFESNNQNISCDVSINNLVGLMKSKFLYWLNEIDGRFRDIVLLVKEWAKAHDINNSKNGSLNSYSLSLLVILHFQTCVPAILPPLKEIYPGNLVYDLTGVRSDVEKQIEETWASYMDSFRSNRFTRVNRSSLSDLLILFFQKFSDIKTRALTQGVCPYTGQWEDVATNMRWLPRTYALFIEDPFQQPDNAARSVSSGQLTRMSDAFDWTYHMLTSANQSKSSMINILVRPQISIFLRTPYRNPSINNLVDGGTHLMSYHQEHRPLNNPPEQNHNHRPQQNRHEKQPNNWTTLAQNHNHRSQQNRHEKHPNGSTTRRPVQATQIQNQQVWRPRSN